MQRLHGQSHKNNHLYLTWKNMRNRCNNPNNPRYEDYGGRGIKVCDEWESYLEFESWALDNGYEAGLSLDRKDNDKGYSPENCKWATDSEQARNKRNNIKVQGKLLVDIAKDARLPVSTVYRRYFHYGMRDIVSLSAPIRRILVEGKTLKEISKMSGIGYGTIKSRYYRGANSIEDLTKEVV